MLFFNDTATTEIYTYLHTLSLHDALPISFQNRRRAGHCRLDASRNAHPACPVAAAAYRRDQRLRRAIKRPTRRAAFGRIFHIFLSNENLHGLATCFDGESAAIA